MQRVVFSYRYSRVDFLYLNAGIMPNPTVDIGAFFKGLFSRLEKIQTPIFYLFTKREKLSNSSINVCFSYFPHCRNAINMFATAEGLLTQQDRVNSDGLQEVFATNLFGHFLLVKTALIHTWNT